MVADFHILVSGPWKGMPFLAFWRIQIRIAIHLIVRRNLPLLRMLLTRRLKVTSRTLHDPRTIAWIRRRKPDVGLHATGCIYRKTLFDSFRIGVLNPHIGVLPEYRGRSVMEWTILQGGATGITTFFMDEGIDTGPNIVIRREVDDLGVRDVTAAKNHLFTLDAEMFALAIETLQSPGYSPTRQDVDEGKRYYVMSGLFTDTATSILNSSRI